MVPTGAAVDVEDLDTSEPLALADHPPSGSAASGPAIPRTRRPWLSAQKRFEMGKTPACPGCEALLITGDAPRPHSKECWDRITGILNASEDGQATLARSQARMEQYQQIVANSVAPETLVEAAPPPTPKWPEPNEVEGAESDPEDEPPQLESLSASIDAVYARYIDVKPDGKLTKEGIRQIFERLDAEHTKKANSTNAKACTGKSANDVSEVFSPPRVTEVAEATGLRPGWALDLTINKEDGTPWDLSLEANQDEAL